MGEYPREDETRTGVPFSTSDGTLLTNLMNQAGIQRSECYITNVIKYEPPGGSLKRLGEIGLDRATCEQELRDELSQLNPNVIVPVGNIALNAVRGHENTNLYRGSILESFPSMGSKKVIPIIHPSTIMKKYEFSLPTLFDLMRIRKESEFPDFRSILKRNYIIDPTFQQCLELLEHWKSCTRLALDLETDFGARYIKCIGFADSPTSAGCIPITNGLKPKWNLLEEKQIWLGVQEILRDPTKEIIIQNMSFELEVLYDWVGEIANVYMDTMLASHLYLPEMAKRLAMQCSVYTTEPYYKDDAKEANYESKSLWTYNCKDCAVTYEISEYMDRVLRNDNLHDLLHGFQMPLGRILWTASHIGVKIDIALVEKRREETQQKVKEAEARLLKILGFVLNINSPKQVCSLLYDQMGLPKQFKKGAGGKRSLTSDEKAITKLSKLFPSDVFDVILELRGLLKFLNTYCKEFWDADGRCHTSYRQTGAVTGRLSSSENIKGTGLNLQNIPGSFRDVIISDDGTTFIVVDLSQVESRLVAYEAQDPIMMKVFEDGKDIHAMIGSMIHGRPYELCSKGTLERDGPAGGKRIGHSSNYGISAQQYAATVGITKSQAQQLLDKYYKLFNISKWHGEVIEQLRKNRTIITPHGRRRIFYGRWPTWKEEEAQRGELFKAAYANRPQGTANDHINLCGVRIFHQVDNSVLMLIQCHDEWVFQCPDELVEETKEIIRETMKFPIHINGRDVIIPIDMGTGKNWKIGGGK